MHLVMSGPLNWHTDIVRQYVADLGLQDLVFFPGFVDDIDLPALYSGAECYVLPTLYEGFCLPLIEAMASGTPVVSSNTTAVPEIAGEAAVLVNPTSVDEIADAIRSVLDSETLRKQCSERGLARSKRFTWSSCAESTLKVYNEATAQRSARVLR
jgi:glycosyltransferase involved in cell wall biosynthesis